MRCIGRNAMMVACLALTVLAVGLFGMERGYAATSDDGEVAAPNFTYELKETGSFKGETDAITIKDGAALLKAKGGVQLLGKDGKPVLDGKVFAGAKYWGNGVYRVEATGDDINRIGLVSVSSKEILPCEAALLVTSEEPVDARFVEVIYATGETDDKSAAAFFVHKGEPAVGTPANGDTLYTGYARVFDLQKGAFVEGIQIEGPQANAVTDMGQSFAVTQGEDVSIYDETGQLLWNHEGDVVAHARYVQWLEKDKTQIMDPEGEGRYVTTKDLKGVGTSAAWWSGDYVSESTGSYRKLLNFDGDRVFKERFARFAGYCNGLFSVSDEDEGEIYDVVDMNGDVVATDVVGDIHPIVAGYNRVDFEEERAAIIKGNQIVWQGDASDEVDCLALTKSSKVRVLNKDDYSLKLDSMKGFDVGLVAGRSDGSMSFGVYDLFQGKQLLEDVHDIVKYAGGCVYAHKDGVWTVYEATLTEEK